MGNARGGRTAAILASLTSTSRRHDADPQLYLTQLLMNLPSVRISDLAEWLPDEWKRRQAARPASRGRGYWVGGPGVYVLSITHKFDSRNEANFDVSKTG